MTKRENNQRKEEMDLRLKEIELERAELEYEEKLREQHDRTQLNYYFFGEVSEEKVLAAIEKINTWSRHNQETDLHVTLNSPGGYVVDGLALHDFLLNIPNHVTITCFGQASSMGSIILQAGDSRVMGRNALVLIHEPSFGSYGNMHRHKDTVECSDIMWENMLQILSERSTMSVNEIRKQAQRKDWWLSANEALKLGFVDEVI